MEHLDFVLWMIGWPVASNVSDYLAFKKGRIFSQNVINAANIVSVAIWAGVGTLVYT